MSFEETLPLAKKALSTLSDREAMVWICGTVQKQDKNFDRARAINVFVLLREMPEWKATAIFDALVDEGVFG